MYYARNTGRVPLRKAAGFWQSVTATASTALKDYAYLLAVATGAVGVGTGWVLAKADSKGVGASEAAGKLYESQRLDSDIAYLRAKLAEERERRRQQQIASTEQKDARLLRI